MNPRRLPGVAYGCPSDERSASWHAKRGAGGTSAIQRSIIASAGDVAPCDALRRHMTEHIPVPHDLLAQAYEVVARAEVAAAQEPSAGLNVWTWRELKELREALVELLGVDATEDPGLPGERRPAKRGEPPAGPVGQ